MMEKGPKTLIKSQRFHSNRTIGNGCFTSLKSCKTSIFKQMRKVFNPMAINPILVGGGGKFAPPSRFFLIALRGRILQP